MQEVSSGNEDLYFDLYFCQLQTDINICEVENLISSEYAWQLREKYLGMSKQENT